LTVLVPVKGRFDEPQPDLCRYHRRVAAQRTRPTLDQGEHREASLSETPLDR